MEINFTSEIWKEGNAYVAYSPELDVSSCGKTIGEAKENLLEAVEGFLEEAEKMGTLRIILEEAGFTKEDKEKQIAWKAPELLSLERVSFAL